jgi:hypothetical protein
MLTLTGDMATAELLCCRRGGGGGVTPDDAFGFARVGRGVSSDLAPLSVLVESAARSSCSTEATPERYRARCSQRLAALIWIALTREVLEHNKQSKKHIQH